MNDVFNNTKLPHIGKRYMTFRGKEKVMPGIRISKAKLT